ncbi:hypothetical protein AGMMS49938_11600 [Fibrobacterales bacterium]|nr:hypothetical protein AGMMS49938_11600 [Fibrobacterales bacterium]
MTFYSGKKVFITGHSGFKGTWLSLWLTHLGAQVYGYSLPFLITLLTICLFLKFQRL